MRVALMSIEHYPGHILWSVGRDTPRFQNLHSRDESTVVERISYRYLQNRHRTISNHNRDLGVQYQSPADKGI